MLNQIIEVVKNSLLAVFGLPELVTVFIAVLPIVEVRGAIPIATSLGLNPFLGGLYAFIGSSAIVPLLLLVLLPFINWLGRTRLFKKVGAVLYEKFEQKSRGLAQEPTEENDGANASETSEAEKTRKKKEWKKILGVFAFVAVPLPLTGVWTGSAVAAIVKLKYPKAVAAVIAGNFVASAIITTLCALLPQSVINYIILAIGIIAVAVVIYLIVKVILHKPKAGPDAAETENDAGKKEEK